MEGSVQGYCMGPFRTPSQSQGSPLGVKGQPEHRKVMHWGCWRLLPYVPSNIINQQYQWLLGCLLLILSELKFPNATVSSVDCVSIFIFHLEKIISFQAAPRRKRRALCASVKEEEVVPYFQECLPTEVLVHIFSFLRERDLCSVGQVCQRFYEISNLEPLWRNLFYRVFEMDQAYIPPHPSCKLSSPSPSLPLSQQSWKEQFSIMVCTHTHTHTYTRTHMHTRAGTIL